MDALVIKDLRKVYKSGVEALKGIDLTVREGDSSRCSGRTAPADHGLGIVTS